MEESNKEERMWAMIAHLSAFSMYLTGIGYILGPLIVWLVRREGHPFVEEHAKEALNFQITVTLIAVAGVILCVSVVLLVIGIAVLASLHLYQVVCMIIAAVKANEGV